jgi:PadR family transcriptional regulator, regulatory protein AphA
MTRLSDPLTLEYILLGILESRPMHGYDLHRELTAMDGISMIWNLKQSMLYALLDKLEAKGFLTCTVIPGDSRPSRKQYRLTDAGQQSFQDWVNSPVNHGRDMRQDFLARLYFAYQSGPSRAHALIDRQREVCKGWITATQAQHEQTEKNLPFSRLVLSFRISQVNSMLEWLDSCEQELKK